MLLALSSFLFAMMAVAAKESSQRLPGAEVACLRFVIGALTVGLFSLFGLRLSPHSLSVLLLRGLLGSGAVLLYFVAIAHLPVGVATLLNNSSPLFVAAFSWLFLGEPLLARTLWAFLLTTAGVLMVVLGNSPLGGGRSLDLRYILLGLGSAVLAGGAVTTIRAMRRREGSWEIFFAFCVIGALVTAVPTAYQFVWPTRRDAFWIAMTGLFSSAYQVMMTYSLKDVPAVQAGLLLQLTPIATFAFGALWLGELPSLLGWLGAALTIFGVCWGLLVPAKK